MVKLAEKERREGTEKGYDERMDMIMEVRRHFGMRQLLPVSLGIGSRVSGLESRAAVGSISCCRCYPYDILCFSFGSCEVHA